MIAQARHENELDSPLNPPLLYHVHRVAETIAHMTAVPDRDRAADIEALRADIRLPKSRWKRLAYIAAGCILVLIGVPGLVLPALPGTPLLLLAAACFARGSERFYIWLLTNPLFGKYVRTWRERRGIPLHIKVKVTALLVASFAVTLLFLMPAIFAARITLVVVGAGVIAYIWFQPTYREDSRG